MEKFLTVCAALILTAGMWSAEPETRKIALTFDDGPHPVYTEEMLKVLEQEQVPATFFLLGENAEQYGEQVRMIAEQGHLIGNHTWRHVQVTSLPKEEAEEEILAVSSLVEELTGNGTSYVRPPFGIWGSRTGRETGYDSRALDH